MKGFKAVKFVSPAGITPVQHLVLSTPPQPVPLGSFSALEGAAGPPPPTTPPPAQTPTGRPASYRTPKSVVKRSGGEPSRLLGTPDYLAPELVRKEGHSRAVDYWALGVCLYEFLIGCTPFNDETPEKVFDNILRRDIEFPEDEESLSPAAVSAILALLAMDPAGRADGEAVRAMELTKAVDWANIGQQQAPFVPQPDDATDTTYFNARNSMQGLTVSDVDI
jgi:serine/threonine-protein kinase greatwall